MDSKYTIKFPQATGEKLRREILTRRIKKLKVCEEAEENQKIKKIIINDLNE